MNSGEPATDPGAIKHILEGPFREAMESWDTAAVKADAIMAHPVGIATFLVVPLLRSRMKSNNSASFFMASPP
jgi:hypothetical protein